MVVGDIIHRRHSPPRRRALQRRASVSPEPE
jgi:hypothetical protein